MRDFILRPLSLLFKHYRGITKSFNFELPELGRSIAAAIEF